jgi:hypothetical protein
MEELVGGSMPSDAARSSLIAVCPHTYACVLQNIEFWVREAYMTQWSSSLPTEKDGTRVNSDLPSRLLRQRILNLILG